MIAHKYLVAATLAVSSLCGCGDIADTFSEWTQGGEKRYVGETENFQLKSGWNRLIASWDAPVDPAITKVKVKWTDDSEHSDSVLVDKDVTSYNITGLSNSSYSVTLTAVSAEGNESLSQTLYARPYTESHEVIQSFSRVISSYYYIGDRLVLKFLGWQDGLTNAVLKYTKKDGEADSLVITQSMAEGNDLFWDYFSKCPYKVLDEPVDKTKPICLYRTGRVSGCEDLINFPVFELTPKKTFSSDFKEALKRVYGLGSSVLDADGSVKDSWADNVTTLSIDDNLTNFDDLLNLPKLKKLVLGAHRYLTDEGINDTERGQLNVAEKINSVFALNTLNALNGLTVERYNKHFKSLELFDETLPYITEMGKPKMPNYKFYDIKNASIKVSPADESGYNSHPEYLLDGNAESCWLPLNSQSSVDYTITVDLKSEKTMSGIELVQKNFGKYDQDYDYAVNKVEVLTAGNSGIFETATNLSEVYMGTSAGETNIIPFSSTRKVRYVQVKFPANAYHGFFAVTFAGLGFYE